MQRDQEGEVFGKRWTKLTESERKSYYEYELVDNVVSDEGIQAFWATSDAHAIFAELRVR